MNLKERKMVHRVYACLDAVPGANQEGGLQSVTVSGVANFALDITKVRRYCLEALEALFDGALTRAERDMDFNAAIGKAEAYITQRKEKGWVSR